MEILGWQWMHGTMLEAQLRHCVVIRAWVFTEQRPLQPHFFSVAVAKSFAPPPCPGPKVRLRIIETELGEIDPEQCQRYVVL